MTPRSLIHTVSALAVVLFAARLPAQDAPEPAVENSKYQIEGKVNGNAVFVRSGPSDNDYATIQLNKGDAVTVVGDKFSWLKIVPPKDSFCYVAKAYVNRTGDGSVGQVNSTTSVNVRIGSQLNLLKTKIASKLEANQRVEIIGELDEYFKIKPPPDVYLYVNKQFVDPVRQVNVAAAPQKQQHQPQQPGGNVPPVGIADNASSSHENVIPSTQPAPAQEEASATPAPSTQPVADAQSEFERLELLYSQSSQRPLDEQPIKEMLSGYEKLASSEAIPESLRRQADYKVSTLRSREKMQDEYVGHKQFVEDMKSKQMSLKSEAQELQEKIDKAKVQFYTAVGTLRTSSLQFGQTPLYRLTDPANGRTVIYLQSDDPKIAQRLGEFIAVRGDVTTDTQRNLTMIKPTMFESVNPSNFGQSVVAQYAPPSLLPGMASGTGTGGE